MIGQTPAPGELVTSDAAAETAALTMNVIKDQALGSFLTMGRLIGPYIAGVLVLALLGFIVWMGRRALAEARRGRNVFDPRPLFDPSATDVLGEGW